MTRREARAVYRLFLVFAGFCAVTVGAAAYWQVVRGPALREDPRNPRLRLSAGLRRGGILSSDGEVLAESVTGPEGVRRQYAGPPGLSATVGYVSPRLGASGLEAAYDAHLRGGTAEAWFARVLGWRHGRGGVAPPDLYLTVESRVQRAAEKAMAGHRGAVVALDPRTGRVLALVSLPGFAPDRVDAEWGALRRRADTPLVNRAVAGLYPPGSAFKPAVALAALEAGKTRPEEIFVCTGRRTVKGQTITDLGGAVHGRVNLAQAMAVSCNYVFSGLAMRLEPGSLAEAAERFGLLAAPDVGLGGVTGRFPDPGRLSREDLAELGIGQGSLLVTPFALARFAALLATGGRSVQPYLVEGLGFPGGRPVSLGRRALTGGRQVVQAQAVAGVNRMLAGVVAQGTGWRAQVAGAEVAGKTGSAENPHGEPHAVFLGFAPVREAVVAVAVVVENGGLGGKVAAPVAQEVIAAALGR